MNTLRVGSIHSPYTARRRAEAQFQRRLNVVLYACLSLAAVVIVRLLYIVLKVGGII